MSIWTQKWVDGSITFGSTSWGSLPGTTFLDWTDKYGGSIKFNYNSGQLHIGIDGNFYHYGARILDTRDLVGYNTTAKQSVGNSTSTPNAIFSSVDKNLIISKSTDVTTWTEGHTFSSYMITATFSCDHFYTQIGTPHMSHSKYGRLYWRTRWAGSAAPTLSDWNCGCHWAGQINDEIPTLQEGNLRVYTTNSYGVPWNGIVFLS